MQLIIRKNIILIICNLSHLHKSLYATNFFLHCCSALHKNIYIGLIYKNHSFIFILVCCKFFFWFFVILVFIGNPHNVKRVQSIYISGGSILNIHVRVNIIVVFVVSFFVFVCPPKCKVEPIIF